MSTPSTSLSPALAAKPSSVASPPLEKLHDAVQQARNLRQVLQDDKQRIGWLLGAGCPLGIYDSQGKQSMRLVPAVQELTTAVAAELVERDKASAGASRFTEHWEALRAECVLPDRSPTVEDILTELRTLSNRRGNAQVLGMTKEQLSKLDDQICSEIAKKMRQRLPLHRCSYHRFASWIGGVHRAFPVEIFTPNYDLLFEEAFEQHPLPHFDGFVGSREPWFDLSSIEHDTIPARWARLWKLHGSVNWERVEEPIGGVMQTRVVRVTREATGRAMIFPSHLKYDQSRRMPYLAMMDRMRAFFIRKPGNGKSIADDMSSDAPRLVVCGYSFLDDHLNEVLLDGLRGNLSAHCFALMYGSLADHPRAVEYATKQGNLTVLATDGAVIGTRMGLYKSGTTGLEENYPWCYEQKTPGDAGGAAEIRVRCQLGDFHFLGLFLEQLCGVESANVVSATSV